MLMTALCCGGALAASTAAAQEFQIPEPLKAGHHELYSRLESATQIEGDTGAAAQEALDAIRGHFEKEEMYALPQLGALSMLADMPGFEGDLSDAQKEDLIARAERFREELPQMLDEHEQIAAALDHLQETATAEGHDEAAQLAAEIGTHAETEELVLYPAALLIGEYLSSASSAEE